jgi:cytochrome c5
MSARELRAVALLGALACALVAFAFVAREGRAAAPAGAASPPSHRHANHLPVGPGQQLAEGACLICHSAMLVTQQRKDSAGWEKTVHQMELWGAPVPVGAHDSLVTYLRARFGAAKK